MKKSFIILSALLLIVLNFSAWAQEEVARDVLELNFYGGLGIPTGDFSNWHDSLGGKTGYIVGIDVGYFVTPQLVAGINFKYSQYSIDNSPTDKAADGLNHRLYNPNLYLKYYFPSQSNWSPYIKAHVGIENPKFTTFVINPNGNRYRQESYDPAFAIGGGAGLFYYTSDYSGIFLETNYHYASTSDVTADYLGRTYKFDGNISVVDIHAGVRILIDKQ